MNDDPRVLRDAALRQADQVELDRMRCGIRRPPEITIRRLNARRMDEGALCRGCIERIRYGERIVVDEDLNCYSPHRLQRWHTGCRPEAVEREVRSFLRARTERRRSRGSLG